MREYFRWETGKAYGEPLLKEEISHWLCHKESAWESLEDKKIEPLTINQQDYDPYDADLVNLTILDQQYVYSSGLGLNCRPHFFIGKLLKHIQKDDFSIYVSGKELARDLPAPPAFSLNRSIFIRRESVKRMIWEKIDEWQLASNHNAAFERVFSHYNLDEQLEQSLELITDNEIESMILHERGEIQAQAILGDQWHSLLADLPRSAAHFMARAVRDHVADCLSTLPALFAHNQEESIHFYFGNFTSLRKQLFPLLGDHYDQWLTTGDNARILEFLERSCHHWTTVAHKILICWQQYGEQSAEAIKELVEQHRMVSEQDMLLPK